MGGDRRLELLYIDFAESYRAFCRHTGHKLPAAVADSWITCSRGNATTAQLAVGCAATKRPAAAAPANGVRRTGHARVQAVRVGYVPSDTITDDIMASSDSEDTNADAHTESEGQQLEQQPAMLGPAYQAELPQLQQRPARPTAAEAKFLTTPVYTPTAGQLQQQQQQEQPNPALALPPGQFHAQWVTAASGAARLQLLQQWLQRSDAAMGQGVAERLGLGLLGWKLAASWSPQEELLFALGMLERYRLFAHMQPRYLPRRSVHELNGYYYSVWKTRAGRLAEEYALLCETDGDPVKFRQSLCMRLAATWDACSSAGCGSDSSWACSSLPVSHGGKGGTSATDAAGGSQKRARLQQSSDDKGRAAYASGRQLSVVDGLASDHDCEVLIIAG
ncbi:hypothetical protein OEZ86_000434 [Tetradesmus obliquus]|nr:hypothetical protein OEZ86_000434 [Tetradesmus obliquus]